MALEPNTEIIITIDKPAAGGRMIGRHDGQVVFVAGAIPGERVRARIDRVSKQLAFASTVEVLDPSPDRRSVDVDWACGGSFYAHVSYDRQLRLKADIIADAFARIAKMPLGAAVSVMASQEHGYRMRARLHVQNGKFGFFREGTHELCDVQSTRQLLPETVDALRRLQHGLHGTQVTSCELSENASAAERVVLFDLAPEAVAPNHVGEIEGVSGLLFIDHQQGHLTVSYGSPYVSERVPVGAATAALSHHVQSFFQGNRYLLPDLVAHVLAQVPEGAVIDLYAGVGLFAVCLAARGHNTIVAVEGDRSSARDLESNAAPYGTAVHVQHLPVEHYLTRRGIRRPDALLLDPPRTGMSREAMSGVLALKVPRVVYLSCDPATLARDVKRFSEVGYHLDRIEGFDLFPSTAHIETLAVLTRT